jgi:HAD superfamily phosphoserine phosphatase-like hydrolase
MNSSWAVATDFDGTITEKDIGNELCIEVLGSRFHDIHGAYRRGELGLKEMQLELWQEFPMAERQFRDRARAYAKLRPGVNEFLERCLDSGVPVFVASCGLRPYIEEALQHGLSSKARSAVREIRSNEAEFDTTKLSRFIPPVTAADCPYPLDKGAWCTELKQTLPPGTRFLGIGNGTSDRSFVGHVDQLAATEALAKWCETQKVEYTPFTDFRDLMSLPIFAR